MKRNFDSEPGTSRLFAIKRPISTTIPPKQRNTQIPHKIIKSEPTEIKKAQPKTSPYHIYSGSIPQIVLVNKSNPPFNILYETFGRIISINPGKFNCEKLVLLRSLDGTGPVLRGLFHEIDLSLSSACRNKQQIVRCIGRFTSQGQFQIIKIGPTDQEFISSINRLNSFSDFSILRT